MGIFKRGREGREIAQKKEAENKAKAEQRRNMPMELWLTKGSTMRVLCLDTPDFFVGRHSIKIKGKFEKVVCIDDSGVICPGCASGKNVTVSVVGTVITLDPVKSADGTKTYVYQKRLLCVAGDAQNFLFKLIDKEVKKNPKFSLRGCVLEISRGTTENAPSFGAFALEGRYSDKAIAGIKEKIMKAKINGDTPIEDYFKPFNYEKAFNPLPEGDLKKIFGVEDAYGSGDDDFASADDFEADSSTTNDLESPFEDDDSLGDTIDDTENGISDDDNQWGSMSDKELLAELIELGVSVTEAKKLDRDGRIARLKEESKASSVAEDDNENPLASMSEDELRELAIENGLSRKAALKMDADALIEAIQELQE